jgi:acetyl-CoA C-acetyltransferase
MNEVYVVAYGRTPIGAFSGSLAAKTGVELGVDVIKGVLEKSGIKAEEIQEAILGNVLQANNGQAPARQAALGAGLTYQTACTTINKVCASGLKSIALGAQSIQLGNHEVVLVGGFESMTNLRSRYVLVRRWCGER